MLDRLSRSFSRLAEDAASALTARAKLRPSVAPADEHDEASPSETRSFGDAETRVSPPSHPRGRRARSHPREVPAPAPDGGSRRREPRFHARHDRIWLQWWRDGELNGLSARLVNVSRHGALIVAGVDFVEAQLLRLVLEDTSTDVQIMGTVRGVVAGSGGLYKVRVEFDGSCPDGFFEAVANGFEAWLSGSRAWI